MTLLLGSIGWGLFVAGGLTHLVHQDRLRDLLAAHVSRPAGPAYALTALLCAIAVAVPVAVLVGVSWAPTAIAVAGAAIGLGFTAWIARLLLSGSKLPCACSFSSGPTSVWSLVRAASTLLIVFLAFASNVDRADAVATLVTGLSAGVALFVLPEAVTWPDFSRAAVEHMRTHRTLDAGERPA